jgi:hypothetical protein
MKHFEKKFRAETINMENTIHVLFNAVPVGDAAWTGPAGANALLQRGMLF